jgi:hypothetical protein
MPCLWPTPVPHLDVEYPGGNELDSFICDWCKHEKFVSHLVCFETLTHLSSTKGDVSPPSSRTNHQLVEHLQHGLFPVLLLLCMGTLASSFLGVMVFFFLFSVFHEIGFLLAGLVTNVVHSND